MEGRRGGWKDGICAKLAFLGYPWLLLTVTFSLTTAFTFALKIQQFDPGSFTRILWDTEIRAHPAQAEKNSGGILIASSLSSYQGDSGQFQ